MKYIKIMILSVLIMIPNWVVAENSNPTQTHTNTPIELGFVSANSSGIRVAAICFLGVGDCGAGEFGEIKIDPNLQCQNEGYDKTSCELPTYLADQCPYNDKYYAKCVADNARSCQEAGYVLSCGSGEVEYMRCPYDVAYKKCKCDPCAGFTYSASEAVAQGYVSDGSCLSCATSKYKRKENPCSGYNSCECGGANGAGVCYTGSVKKFSSCQSCCDPCTGFTYSASEAVAQGYVSDGSCQSCEVTKHKRKENPCSGYATCECGGANGAGVCYTGSVKKFSSCESCRPTCQIGWIYYSDNTCSASVVAGKTALGVVAFLNWNTWGGQIIAAKSIGTYSWSEDNVDVPSLYNEKEWMDARSDVNSCENTNYVIAYGNSNTYPAAHAARYYAPTADTKGKWCLPAAGVLATTYNYISEINAGIRKLGGIEISTVYDNDMIIWSSTENNSYYAWYYIGDGGASQVGIGRFSKREGHIVRPVMEF